VSAEFVINNKVHLAIRISLFIANYRRKLRIVIDIRRKERMEKVAEFEGRVNAEVRR